MPKREFNALHRIADRKIRAVKRAFTSSIQELQRVLSVGKLEQAILDRTALDNLPMKAFENEFTAQVVPIFRTLIKGGAKQSLPFLEKLGVPIQKQLVTEPLLTFDLRNIEAERVAERMAAELVTLVSTETRAAIREIITRGFTEGMSVRDMAREIRDLIGLTRQQQRSLTNFRQRLIEDGRDPDFIERAVRSFRDRKLNQRALIIARHETLRAAEAGQHELFRQAKQKGFLDPVKFVREWITAVDDRVCPICEPMNGQRRSLEENFVSPFDGASALHPPVHIACRCDVRLVQREDVDELAVL